MILLDFLHECEVTLNHLRHKFDTLVSPPIGDRDEHAIDVTKEMIEDLEFSMAEYQLGYVFNRGDYLRNHRYLTRF